MKTGVVWIFWRFDYLSTLERRQYKLFENIKSGKLKRNKFSYIGESSLKSKLTSHGTIRRRAMRKRSFVLIIPNKPSQVAICPTYFTGTGKNIRC